MEQICKRIRMETSPWKQSFPSYIVQLKFQRIQSNIPLASGKSSKTYNQVMRQKKKNKSQKQTCLIRPQIRVFNERRNFLRVNCRCLRSSLPCEFKHKHTKQQGTHQRKWRPSRTFSICVCTIKCEKIIQTNNQHTHAIHTSHTGATISPSSHDM